MTDPVTSRAPRRVRLSSRASLSGKVVVITGAARGLGAALAVNLAEHGARLALVGLETEELARTAAACDQARERSDPRPNPDSAPDHDRAHAHHAHDHDHDHAPSSPHVSTPASPSPPTLPIPPEALPAPVTRTATWHADVTDRARMNDVADEMLSHFGRVDVVVANAGIALGGPTAEADPQAFDRVIEVNLLGSIATARAFLPALIQSRGYLLQIASLAAIAPAPLMAAYCASKSGVEAFAHCLRGEVAHQGVQVGVAYLTWTDTDMVRAADEDPVLQEMRARLPWPANKTAPLAPAAARIVSGIAARKPHVYAQPWIRPLQWLPRAAVPETVARRGAKEVARLSARLHATSHLRQRPLGPGGAAASASASPTAHWDAQAARPTSPAVHPVSPTAQPSDPTHAPSAPASEPPAAPTQPENRVANHPPA